MSKLAVAYAMKKKAKGGRVEGGEHSKDAQRRINRGEEPSSEDEIYRQYGPGAAQKHADRKAIREEEPKPINPKLKGLAEGGVIMDEESGYGDMPEEHVMDDHAADMEDDDMIARIMSKRNMYSEGGKIANEGEDELSHMADGDPNEFDYLAIE